VEQRYKNKRKDGTMTTWSRITVSVALIAAFLILAAIWFVHSDRVVKAQDVLPVKGFIWHVHYMPVGLAPGQTARLNFANIGETHGIIVNYRFLDSDAVVIAQSEHPLTLPAGKMMSVDVDRDTLSLKDPRIEIRAEVEILTPGNPQRSLRQSLEVFDNTSGKTTVFHPRLVEPPDPD
jgi:hypothetical protein